MGDRKAKKAPKGIFEAVSVENVLTISVLFSITAMVYATYTGNYVVLSFMGFMTLALLLEYIAKNLQYLEPRRTR